MSKSDLKFKKNNFIDSNWCIGIVTAQFNQKITSKLLTGALAQLQKSGVSAKQIKSVEVPGAYEIPLAAKWLLESGCDAVIALGAVIRGETTHYDYVCSAVERGCTNLQLSTGCPVVFGVLTTENEAQALARVGGAHGHKGADAASVAIEMLNLKQSLKTKNKKTNHSKKEKKPWPQITQSL